MEELVLFTDTMYTYKEAWEAAVEQLDYERELNAHDFYATAMIGYTSSAIYLLRAS